MGMALGLKDPILTPIQVLYCNLICAVTLGFVLAIEPAEEGIMNLPPRRIGKRLVGRYLLLRIIIASIVLIVCTVGSVFWVRALGYDLEAQRSQASNTLTFAACSVCFSARFAYNSSLHPRVLFGNKYMWWSIIPLAVIQFMITYVPGLNSLLFGMGPQDGLQWGIVVLAMVITLLVMEAEKAVRRMLKRDGVDTDDREYDPVMDEPQQ
jgi:magnesium-transporting ATPase (P-type)